jgi:hypothetical protein
MVGEESGVISSSRMESEIDTHKIKIRVYLFIMKTRLNLTIDDDLLGNVKTYAANKQTSISN